MHRSRLLETVVANHWLLLTLAVALTLRLGLAVAVQQRVDQPPAKLCLIPGDAEGYWELAQKIVAGKDYAIYQPPRYVLRVPGFPLLLAFSQLLFGDSPIAARCLLACLGTAACGLTYWLGRELVNETTGLLAAAYTALSPTQILFSVLLLSETAFATALLISLLTLARLARYPSAEGRRVPGAVTPIVAGGLIGLATLVRPTWLYVGAALAFSVIFIGCPQDSWWNRGRTMLLVVCGIAVSMAPWTIRNYYVTGHVVPTTLWVGASLYDGLNPSATGDSDMRFFESDQLQLQMSEFEVDREYRRRAWEFAAQNPGRAIWLAMKKQQRYWSPIPNASQFQDWWLQVIVCLSTLPLAVLGIRGLWVSRWDPTFLALTVGPILLFAALHLLFVGSLRYRLPAEFPFAVMAAVGITGKIRLPSVSPQNSDP